MVTISGYSPTLREVKTATVNDWSAICWADGEIHKAKDYKGLEIMDRVGGGGVDHDGLHHLTSSHALTRMSRLWLVAPMRSGRSQMVR